MYKDYGEKLANIEVDEVIEGDMEDAEDFRDELREEYKEDRMGHNHPHLANNIQIWEDEDKIYIGFREGTFTSGEGGENPRQRPLVKVAKAVEYGAEIEVTSDMAFTLRMLKMESGGDKGAWVEEGDTISQDAEYRMEHAWQEFINDHEFSYDKFLDYLGEII